MADIEGAERGLAFTSGMAALTAVTRLVKNGEVSTLVGPHPCCVMQSWGPL